ncbi:MAG: hypothetical protein WAU36_04090 [Cyclobacteriaceae bacterium]
MNASEKSIYTSENHKTHRENFNAFLSYVASSVGKEKQDRDRIYKEHLNAMTVPSMKQEMITYHEKISKGGMFTNKKSILEDSLLMMHYHEAFGITKSSQFAEALKSDSNFKKFTIADEAKNLLSGSKLYSYVVSAEESKQLRETILIQDKEITHLATQKNELSSKLDRVNKALTNLVTNLKVKLGFSEEKINELMNTLPDKDKNAGQNKEVAKSGKKDIEIGM